MASARVCLVAACLAMVMVSTVGGSKLTDTLASDPKFSILQSLLVYTGDLQSLERRATELNGSSFLLLAPTDDSFGVDFTPALIDCLKNTQASTDLLGQLLRYFQIRSPTPVVKEADLVSAAAYGQLWTVLGKPINVEAQGAGEQLVVVVSNDEFQQDTTVEEVIVTEPGVALIPLNLGVLVPSALGAEIDSVCSVDLMDAPSSAASASPSESGDDAAPSSPSESGDDAAPSSPAESGDDAAPSSSVRGSARRLLNALF